MRSDGQGASDAARGGSSLGRQCRNCGTHVTPDFARVFGDNQDRVYRCHECADGVELFVGAAAGQ